MHGVKERRVEERHSVPHHYVQGAYEVRTVGDNLQAEML